MKKIWLSFSIVLAVLVAMVFWLNWGWICDFWRGVSYKASAEMVDIREKLGLTERGEFLFNASQPVLDDREEFNEYCRVDDTETAILGCYEDSSIHVYNIKEADLNGIRELTTAHELLHAVWARMSDNERRELDSALTQAFEVNQDLLESELATYDTNKRQEELYVRSGTEIKQLPEVLEKHFAEIFVDQDKVVDFYDSYIGVFKRIENEMNNLKLEIDGIQAAVEEKTTVYEGRVAQFEADVASFNSCAEVSGCFKSASEFNIRRGELLVEREALAIMYDEINQLVEEYNTRVEKYNEDVVYSNKLNNMVNSNSKPELVE